jgi:Asp-tRNA(Asn)/Glu-tRNA(Gln) amidotransferase A subunit family amidase
LQHKGSDLDDLTAHPSSTAIVATKPGIVPDGPVIFVPVGLSKGLPVGLQIVGRRYADEEVLAMAGALEAAVGFLRPW